MLWYRRNKKRPTGHNKKNKMKKKINKSQVGLPLEPKSQIQEALDKAHEKPSVIEPTKTTAVVQQEIEFKKLAHEIVMATAAVGEKYLSVCLYIRENKIMPKQVTAWLLDCGFHKSKASEINRVAQAPDEVFSNFKARVIGWRDALQISRGTVETICSDKSVSKLIDVEAVVAEAKKEFIEDEERKSADANQGQLPPGQPTVMEQAAEAEKKAAELTKKMARAAVIVLQCAEKLGLKKPMMWNVGNGFSVKVATAKKTPKVSKESTGDDSDK